MKKLLTGILAGLMLVTAGCAQKSEPMTEEAVVQMVSGDMKLGGVWEDEKDPKLTVIFIETEENEYEVIGNLEKSDTESETWAIHGKYDPAAGMLSYQDGTYAVKKKNADGDIATEGEKTVQGNFGKIGEKSLTWQDSALSELKTLKFTDRDPDQTLLERNGPRLRLEEGPYTTAKTYREALSEEDKARFVKAVDGQIAVGYTPIQVIATQTVNGTNYAYLAYGEFVLSVKQETYVIIAVHEGSDGTTELLTINLLDVNAPKLLEAVSDKPMLGAWTIADNDADGLLGDEVDDAFANAVNNGDGKVGNLVPIAVLGTSEKDGTKTFRMLVRGTEEAIAPNKALYVFDIEKKADNTSSVASCKPLDLVAYLSAE
ncbi:MAG: hypothetical protein IKD68_10815 [Solobacterium sp.]|nr:hypothetical protein [Solobacterium sp.]